MVGHQKMSGKLLSFYIWVVFFLPAIAQGQCSKVVSELDSIERLHPDLISQSVLTKAKNLKDGLPEGEDCYVKAVVLLSEIYMKVEAYERAFTSLKSELNAPDKQHTSIEKAKFNYQLGTAYRRAGKLDSSILYFNHEMELLESIPVESNLEMHIFSYSNIAMTHFERGEIDKTFGYLRLGKEISKAHNHWHGLTLTEVNIGTTHLEIGALDSARIYIESALLIARKHSLRLLEVETLVSLAELHQKTELPVSAIELFEEAIEINTTLDRGLTIEREIYLFSKLHDCQIMKGDYDGAEASNKRKSELEEQRIELLLKNQGDQFELTNNLLKKEIANKKLAITNLVAERRNVILTSSIVILILVSMLAFFILKKRNQRLRQEVKHKKRVISEFSTHHKINRELLVKLKKKLKSMKSTDSETLVSLERKIEEIFMIEDVKSTYFDDVDQHNQDFFYKLEIQYPQLTDKDKNVCALILLGMSSKEVANILQISPKSVNNQRSKIRTILDLPKGTPLANHLRNI